MTIRLRTVIISATVVLAAAITALVSLNLILTHAFIEHQKGSSICPHDKEFRTYEEWTRTVTFPYVAPEERLRRVKENYSRIDVDASKRAIVEAFGPPDFEQESIPKEPWRPCIGYELDYFFAMLEAGNDNEIKDKRIQVRLIDTLNLEVGDGRDRKPTALSSSQFRSTDRQSAAPTLNT